MPRETPDRLPSKGVLRSPTMHNARRSDRRALCPKSGFLLAGGKLGHVAVKDRLLLRGENSTHIGALLRLQLRKLRLKSHVRVGRSVLFGGLVRGDFLFAKIAVIRVVLLLDRLELLLLRGRQANSLGEKLLIVSELELRAVGLVGNLVRISRGLVGDLVGAVVLTDWGALAHDDRRGGMGRLGCRLSLGHSE